MKIVVFLFLLSAIVLSSRAQTLNATLNLNQTLSGVNVTQVVSSTQQLTDLVNANQTTLNGTSALINSQTGPATGLTAVGPIIAINLSSPVDYILKYVSLQGVTLLPVSRVSVIPLTVNPGLGDVGFLAFQAALVPLIYAVSEPLQARIARIFAVSAYEAWATYDPKASGVIFGKKLKRSPEQQLNITAKQTTIYYAICRTLGILYPVLRPTFFNITTSLGLNPLDTNNDTATAVGLGNFIAFALVDNYLKDEFNQLGLLNWKGFAEFNRAPYVDYSHYKPVNTEYDLKDPTRWQPELVTDKEGNFWGTTFPQSFWGLPAITTTFAVKSSLQFLVPPPVASKTFASPLYLAQADIVIKYSAELNDYTKMLAEYFHDPVQTTGFPEIFLINKYGWGLDELVKWNFITSNGLYDGDSTVWFYKRMYDSVRPQSVIRHTGLYKKILAWGGPGQGTVLMDAYDWRPYLVNRPSTEYPSGASCGCAVIAEAGRRFTGTDVFGLTLISPPGISYVEPGITPAQPVVLSFPTFTDFENKCKEARVIGGIHFPPATEEGRRVCKWATSLVFDKAKLLFNGVI